MSVHQKITFTVEWFVPPIRNHADDARLVHYFRELWEACMLAADEPLPGFMVDFERGSVFITCATEADARDVAKQISAAEETFGRWMNAGRN